jgi:hypothetical protein
LKRQVSLGKPGAAGYQVLGLQSAALPSGPRSRFRMCMFATMTPGSSSHCLRPILTGGAHPGGGRQTVG